MSTYSLNLTLANIRTITTLVLDILVVWLLLYYVLRIVRNNTRTIQIFKGILLVVVVDGIAKLLGLKTLQFFADIFINWGFLAIIIIFQPEIRALLEHMGKSNVFSRITTLSGNEKGNLVDQIVTAVMLLSKDQTGALISIEQSRSLEDYINTGTRLNSDVTAELLTSLFVTTTPLHDGAVIIQGDKIACASAYLPSTNLELPSRYGARHRAAIGISEVTDAVTICVSEETGNVSITEGGKLMVVDREQLRNYLLRVICGEATELHAKRQPREIYVSDKNTSRKEEPKEKKSVLSKIAIRRRDEEVKEETPAPRPASGKVAVEEVIPASGKKAVEKQDTAEMRRQADAEAEAAMMKLPHKKKKAKPSYPEKKAKVVKKVEEEPAPVSVPAAPAVQETRPLREELQPKPIPAAVREPEVQVTETDDEIPDLTKDTSGIPDEAPAPRTRFEEVRAAREAAYRIMYSQQAEHKEKQQTESVKKAVQNGRDGRYDTTQLDISKIVGFSDELDSTFDMVDDMPRSKGGKQ